jgi:hypothetical protein
MKKLLIILMLALQAQNGWGLSLPSEVKGKKIYDLCIEEFMRKILNEFATGEKFHVNYTILPEQQDRDSKMGVKKFDRSERAKYRAYIKGGYLYDYRGKLIQTPSSKNPLDPEIITIFVLGVDGGLYFYHKNIKNVSEKIDHSSFLGNDYAIYSAGECQVKKGSLIYINNKATQYNVEFHHFLSVIDYLIKHEFKFEYTRVSDRDDSNLQAHLITHYDGTLKIKKNLFEKDTNKTKTKKVYGSFLEKFVYNRLEEFKTYKATYAYHNIIPEWKEWSYRVGTRIFKNEELEQYRVRIVNGRLRDYKGRLIHTPPNRDPLQPGAMTTLFVLGPDSKLYFYHKNPYSSGNKVCHDSFFGYNIPIYASGEFVAVKGRLTSINNRTGHYQVKFHNFLAVIDYLIKHKFKFTKTRVSDWDDSNLRVIITTLEGGALVITDRVTREKQPDEVVLTMSELVKKKRIQRQEPIKIKSDDEEKEYKKLVNMFFTKEIDLTQCETKECLIDTLKSQDFIKEIKKNADLKRIRHDYNIKEILIQLKKSLYAIQDDSWVEDNFFKTPYRLANQFYIPQFDMKKMLDSKFKDWIYSREFMRGVRNSRIIGVSYTEYSNYKYIVKQLTYELAETHKRKIHTLFLDEHFEKYKNPTAKNLNKIRKYITKLSFDYDHLIVVSKKTFYYKKLADIMDMKVFIDKDSNRRFLEKLQMEGNNVDEDFAALEFFRNQFTEVLDIGLPQAENADILIDTTAGFMIYERSA